MPLLSDITSPTLLLDEQKCRSNIRSMARKAEEHNLEFRPHFKTHQSPEIAEWFREEGVRAITVSSVDMALYFAGHGWKDITIAFPVNPREIGNINVLAGAVQLTLLVGEHTPLGRLQSKLEHRVHIFIEINTGANRTGMKVDDTEKIENLVTRVTDAETFIFSGFYTHPGHSYDARSKEEINRVHKGVLEQLSKLDERYGHSEYLNDNLTICTGDTPCCSVADIFSPANAISPGNFVFYDLMQVHIGSCSIDDIAVCLACPIVDKYPDRNEIVVHGGAVHLSKDAIESKSVKHYGIPVKLQEGNGWDRPLSGAYVKALSQEHGIIRLSEDDMHSFRVGDILGILPVHSCLTADLMKGYRTLDGRQIQMQTLRTGM